MTGRHLEFKKIGEVAEVKGGKRLPIGMVVQDGPTNHPYLRVVDFGPNGIDRSSIKYITKEAYEAVSRYTISHDDIYISIAGTIGRIGVVPEDLSGANLTENAAKITSIDDSVDRDFLMYFLQGPVGQGSIQSKTGGTSQPKLALYRIKEIEFQAPALFVQQKIASILSAYDDLIENNLRRIALLEESARLLYQEWFVNLRFPGHEHTPIVDGVPEGWEKRPLGDNAVLNYGKALKADNRREGPYPVYGSSGIVGTHEKALVKGPGIIIGRKGNVGSVFWSKDDFYPIDTVYYIDSKKSHFYLYYALQNMHFISNDVAVPGLNRNFAYSRLYVEPSSSIVKVFEEVVSPMHEKIFKLDVYNQKLKLARDLLLPKLMNGEISV